MSHKLAVITVIYRNYSILEDFFDSFSRQTSNNFIIYIVDLSDSPEVFKHPSFVHVLKSTNKGYAHGINVGLKRATDDGFELFSVINSDTTADVNFVNVSINRLIETPGSIIGGKIYYYPGYEYHKERYSKDQLGGVIWYAGGHIDWNNVMGVHRGVDEVAEKKYSKFEQTDFVTGCLMCFDKKVIYKIGYLDESYFLYYEDADWCERAKRAGINLYYDPNIIIWHKNAQSTGGAGSKLHQKYQEKNRLKFGLKYAPLRTKLHLIKNLAVSKFIR